LWRLDDLTREQSDRPEEHLLDMEGVTGSIPVAPTILANHRNPGNQSPATFGKTSRANNRIELSALPAESVDGITSSDALSMPPTFSL
jgi:hypothetical protein